MAKAKRGTNLSVPKTDADAEQLLARIGAAERDLAARKAQHDEAVALLEQGYGAEKREADELIYVMTAALRVWAEAHRARLTNDGRTKTVKLATGEISWRLGKASLTLGGHPIPKSGPARAAVIDEIQKRIMAAMAAARALSRSSAERRELMDEADGLSRFLRQEVSLKTSAMHDARDLAATVPGIGFSAPVEEFEAKPLASQIREVA